MAERTNAAVLKAADGTELSTSERETAAIARFVGARTHQTPHPWGVWVPKTVEVLSTTTVTGPYVKTCDLPAAELRWAKDDATPTDAVNEAESIQPKDAGVFYRQVDCKYIYNLAVSSLTAPGTYTVWVVIDGAYLQVPATFDLR